MPVVMMHISQCMALISVGGWNDGISLSQVWDDTWNIHSPDVYDKHKTSHLVISSLFASLFTPPWILSFSHRGSGTIWFVCSRYDTMPRRIQVTLHRGITYKGFLGWVDPCRRFISSYGVHVPLRIHRTMDD